MPDFQNAKIYKLVNSIDSKIFVGSSCQDLCVRKATHRYMARYEPHRAVYLHLNTIGWENVKIILIEKFPCKDREEMKKREHFWYEQLKPCLNERVPFSTPQNALKKNQERDARFMARHKEERTFVIQCPCGGHYQIKNQWLHLNRLIHLKWVRDQATIETKL